MEERVFFNAGDRVKVKHKIDGPVMLVKHVNKAHERGDTTKPLLIGITCFWFTKNHEYQSQLFSTKDLVHAGE